jgi:hypothetical protein
MDSCEAVKVSNVAASLWTSRRGAAQFMAYREESEQYLKYKKIK